MYTSGPTPELYRTIERERRARLELAAHCYRLPLGARSITGPLTALRERLATMLLQAGMMVMPADSTPSAQSARETVALNDRTGTT